jgi:GR25 family glycosyltransferase involved in LPS biosynthesis
MEGVKRYDINNYFDKIYVINLERRVDRKYKIEQRLKKHQITNYKMFAATDGSKSQMYSYYLRHKGFTDTPGAFGILSSAARVINDAVKSKYQRILILEDDAVFHTDFDNQFNDRISQIPQDWKLLYFGTSMRRHRIADISQHNRKKHFLTSKGTIAGAFAIGIDASVFPDLLMDLNITNKPWDLGPLRTINLKYNNKCIVLYPYLILCDTRDSDIRRNKSLQEKYHTCGWDVTKFEYE